MTDVAIDIPGLSPTTTTAPVAPEAPVAPPTAPAAPATTPAAAPPTAPVAPPTAPAAPATTPAAATPIAPPVITPPPAAAPAPTPAPATAPAVAPVVEANTPAGDDDPPFDIEATETTDTPVVTEPAICGVAARDGVRTCIRPAGHDGKHTFRKPEGVETPAPVSPTAAPVDSGTTGGTIEEQAPEAPASPCVKELAAKCCNKADVHQGALEDTLEVVRIMKANAQRQVAELSSLEALLLGQKDFVATFTALAGNIK